MQDRNLQDKKRVRRRRQKLKQKKRAILYRRVFLLVIAICILYFFGKFIVSKFSNKENPINGDKKNNGEVKFSLEEDKKEDVKKGPVVDTNISFDMMKNNLDQRIRSFLNSNKISKDNLSIGYFNMATDEDYSYNGDREFYVGDANNFMIAMDIYDLALEKDIDLDAEFELSAKRNEGEGRISKKFTLREFIKLMISQDNKEAREHLIEFIEEKSSKNWYDEVSKRYGINLSYTNQISSKDCLKVLRRLFSQRKMTAQERIKAEDGKTTVLVYQELVNFMSSKKSSNALINNLSKHAQVSSNSSNQYDDNSLMGYILGQKQYLYVIMTRKADKYKVFDGLNTLDQWFDYYHK